MATVPRMTAGLASYALSDLEALERERPELGRLEVVDGALHATGESAVGDQHQRIVQGLLLLLVGLCPATHLVRLDTWWETPNGKLRPDVAVYRVADRPPSRRAFRVPPVATVEVLSDDADHDLVRKEQLYARLGVRHRAYVEPWGRGDWWCPIDGVDRDEPTVELQLNGWPPVLLGRDALLAD